MDNPVIIFGAGGLGKAALEIFEGNQVAVYGFLDDDVSLHNTEIKEVKVLGSMDDDQFLKYLGKKCEAFIAIDDNEIHRYLVKMLNEDKKVMPVNAIHRGSMLASNAVMGHGNFINAGVKLASFTTLGSHCILNTGAIIEHNTKLGNYVQVGAGTIVNSGVTIEDQVFIGSGVTIVSGIKIGKGARIGAGSVVIEDVGSNITMFGNPAKRVD